MSIFGGLQGSLHPRPLKDPTWNYIVLSTAAIFESVTWTIAYREFRRVKGSLSWWSAMRTSKDPMAFTVLVEDTAAMVGLAIALLGIASADALSSPRLDAAAAVLIGIILGAVGLVLAYKCKGLLIGESVEPGVLASIQAIANADPAVARLVRALTMHLGPTDVLLTMEIQFRPELSAGAVALISPARLGTLFEPFVHDERRSAVGGGLGIGLAVVRDLVQAHGGAVVARSRGENLGSEFSVTLPIRGTFI